MRISSVMSWSNPSQPSSVHFLVILLVTVSCTATGQDAGSITHYDVARTADGGHCTWFVARSTLERVALVMTCRCRDGSGKSQGYSCQYDGILDECEKYQTHTKELSDGLVKSIVDNHESGCSPEELETDMCPGVFLKRSKFIPAPSPCINSQREEL